MKKDYRNLINKKLKCRSCIKNSLLKCICQKRFFINNLSLFLRKVKYSK